MNALDILSGGCGCDLVTVAMSPFTARKGYIHAIIVNEDSTGITSIKEMLNGTATSVTSRSYLATNTLKENRLIKPDYPVTEITVAAGTVWVFYGASL